VNEILEKAKNKLKLNELKYRSSSDKFQETGEGMLSDSALKKQYSASHLNTGTKAMTTVSSVFQVLPEEISLEMPITPRESLVTSGRDPACSMKRNRPPSCDLMQALVSTRSTANPRKTCFNKLQFDIDQLRHIAFEDMSLTQEIIRNRLPKIQALQRALAKKYSKKHMSQLVELTDEEMEIAAGSINSALAIARRLAYGSQKLTHSKALEQLPKALNELEQNDFAVLDVVVESRVIKDLSSALLKSTVWYDNANGEVFAAHPDDGLHWSEFAGIGKDIASAVSNADKKYKISKYFAIAADVSRTGKSPLMIGGTDEICVVLWLNPVALPADPATRSDGLQIFDRRSSETLAAQGVANFPLVHKDFYSVKGDLDIRMNFRCPSAAAELVPRMNNRVVLIAPRRPFLITSQSIENSAGKPFDLKTSFVIVYVLKLDRT